MEPGTKRNILLILEYDGTGLAGWQRQRDQASVQGHIEDALSRLTGEKIKVTGAGRTDAGVHARGQAANFYTESKRTLSEIVQGGNALLPPQIAVLSANEVPLDFHARFNALGKIYDYDLKIGSARPALNRLFVWHLKEIPDLKAMRRALPCLIGKHDFACYQSTGSSVCNTVRTITRANMESLPNDVYRITLEADGFLRHMVRAIVGTLVQVGQGRMNVERFGQILNTRDRSLAGPTAPARGLFLRKVLYEPLSIIDRPLGNQSLHPR